MIDFVFVFWRCWWAPHEVEWCPVTVQSSLSQLGIEPVGRKAAVIEFLAAVGGWGGGLGTSLGGRMVRRSNWEAGRNISEILHDFQRSAPGRRVNRYTEPLTERKVENRTTGNQGLHSLW